jgi:hypothetical protein
MSATSFRSQQRCQTWVSTSTIIAIRCFLHTIITANLGNVINPESIKVVESLEFAKLLRCVQPSLSVRMQQ